MQFIPLKKVSFCLRRSSQTLISKVALSYTIILTLSNFFEGVSDSNSPDSRFKFHMSASLVRINYVIRVYWMRTGSRNQMDHDTEFMADWLLFFQVLQYLDKTRAVRELLILPAPPITFEVTITFTEKN